MGERAPTKIGRFATLRIDRVLVEADRDYTIAGVLNAGKGLFTRGILRGSGTGYSHLHRLHEGQLVMRKLTAWEGPITAVPKDFDGQFVSGEFPTFDLDTAAVLPDYMTLVCQQPSFWAAMRDRVTGTVQRRKRLSPTQLLDIEINLPPIAEQRRIVDLLQALDTFANAAWHKASACWAARGALLDEVLDASESGCRQVRLAELLSATIGGVWGQEAGTSELDVLVARSTEFRATGVLNLDRAAVRSVTAKQLATRALAPGDILLEKSGGGPKQPVGRVVLIDRVPDLPSVCSNFVQLVRPNPNVVVPQFLFLVMWRWHAAGETLGYQAHTTGIRNLRTKDYLSRFVSLPPIKEQLRIVELLADVVRHFEAATQVAEAARHVVSAALVALLSGSHEIPESYDALLEAVA